MELEFSSEFNSTPGVGYNLIKNLSKVEVKQIIPIIKSHPALTFPHSPMHLRIYLASPAQVDEKKEEYQAPSHKAFATDALNIIHQHLRSCVSHMWLGKYSSHDILHAVK